MQLVRRVTIRLTADEEQQLRDAADCAGLSISEYLRRRVHGHRVASQTDATVIRELRRIGGLLKLVHTESGGAYSQQTAAMLSELRDCIERIARGAE